MAQSIYVTLDTLKIETSVPAIGGMVEHTLPAEQFPTAEQFGDEEKLLAWAKENNCLHSCLQKGINQHLIDIRAEFKKVKKDETWSEEIGYKNINSYEWKVKTRPATAKSDEEKAIEALGKLSPEKLAEILAKMK